MENQRTLLYLSLFFILFLIWQAWQKDYGPQPVAIAPTDHQVGSANEQPASVSVNDIPESVRPAGDKTVPNIPEASGSRSVHVITDVFDLEIDTRGGDIRKLNLRQYAKSSEFKDELRSEERRVGKEGRARGRRYE